MILTTMPVLLSPHWTPLLSLRLNLTTLCGDPKPMHRPVSLSPGPVCTSQAYLLKPAVSLRRLTMSLNDEHGATRPPRADSELPAADPPVLTFESMASGQREVVIEYRGQHYRLRATRSGKLILNK